MRIQSYLSLNKGRDLLLFILAFFSLAPSVFTIVETFGFHWTIYRFLLVTLVFLWLCIRALSTIRISKKTLSFKWMLMLLCWIIWFFPAFILSAFRDSHRAFLEILSLANAFFMFLLITYLSHFIPKGRFITVFNIILVANICLAFFEIISGHHTWTSMLVDKTYGDRSNNSMHLATGFMYNVNDFSTCITCLLPFAFIFKKKSITFLIVLCVMMINHINDANICNLGILVGLVYFFFFYRKKDDRIKIFGAVFCIAIVVAIAGIIIFFPSIANRLPVISTLSRQISNAQENMGSLYKRLTIYKESILAVIPRKLWGYGPASFTNYFTRFPSMSYLVNPHGYLIEILFEYGIFILAWFVYCLGSLVGFARKHLRSLEDHNQYGLIAIEFVILFAFCSFSPSTFFTYQFHWAIIATLCVILNEKKEEKIECRF